MKPTNPPPGSSQPRLLVTLVALIQLLISMPQAQAQPTFAERLGYKPGQVVVILHVDDVGMSRSSNLGGIQAVEKGVASSWAVMMPCPWVSDIAAYLKQHPNIDSGLHLTLTSEWKPYRWGPLSGRARTPGLVDDEGCLWRDVKSVATHATADEVEMEIREQVARAERLGIPITHLDSHMGTLFARADYFERFAKVGIEKQIPILAIGGHATHARRENGEAIDLLKAKVEPIWQAGLPVLDDLHTGSGSWPPEKKTPLLVELLRSLNPGVTEILFHASLPTEDFPVITASSNSRLGDLRALTSPEVAAVIKEKGIVLTTWRELMQRRRNAK